MERIREIYLKGIEDEKGNRFNSAYKNYIDCINESVKNISLCSLQPGQQNTWNSFMKVTENCLEKLRRLYPKLKRQLNVQQQNPQQKISFQQPRANISMTQSQIQPLSSPIQNIPTLRPQYSHPMTQTLPSNLSYQSGSFRKIQTKSLSFEDEFKKLRQEIEMKGIRKMNENEIQKRHQFQILKMQQETEKQAKNHRRSIKNRLYSRVNWRRNDQWARFIQSNFLYMEMNNQMLLKDKQFFENIGKSPTKYLFPHYYGANTSGVKLPNQPFEVLDLTMTSSTLGPRASGSFGAVPLTGPYRASVLPHDPNERKEVVKEEIRVFIDKYVLFEPPKKVDIPQEQMAQSLRFGTAVDYKRVLPLYLAEKHKLLVLVERFVAYIRDEYFLPRKNTLETLNIHMVQEDILSFVQNTVGILLSKYWAVPSEGEVGSMVEKQLVNGMYVAIFRYIQQFYTKIDCQLIIPAKTSQPPPRINSVDDSRDYELRLNEYKKLVDLVTRNRSYNRKVMEFGSTVTLKQLGLKKKYRLDEDEILYSRNKKTILPYQEVIDMFCQFVDRGWVVEKIQITEHCLKRVAECVNEYHLQVHGPQREPPPVGAEELLPIFVYCLLKTGSVDMIFTFYYIENFLTEDLLRGSMGYSLATLETALNYIANNLSTQDLLDVERKMNEKEGFVIPQQPQPQPTKTSIRFPTPTPSGIPLHHPTFDGGSFVNPVNYNRNHADGGRGVDSVLDGDLPDGKSVATVVEEKKPESQNDLDEFGIIDNLLDDL